MRVVSLIREAVRTNQYEQRQEFPIMSFKNYNYFFCPTTSNYATRYKTWQSVTNFSSLKSNSCSFRHVYPTFLTYVFVSEKLQSLKFTEFNFPSGFRLMTFISFPEDSFSRFKKFRYQPKFRWFHLWDFSW